MCLPTHTICMDPQQSDPDRVKIHHRQSDQPNQKIQHDLTVHTRHDIQLLTQCVNYSMEPKLAQNMKTKKNLKKKKISPFIADNPSNHLNCAVSFSHHSQNFSASPTPPFRSLFIASSKSFLKFGCFLPHGTMYPPLSSTVMSGDKPA